MSVEIVEGDELQKVFFHVKDQARKRGVQCSLYIIWTLYRKRYEKK